MSIETDSLDDGYDRTFFTYSSRLAEPFCWAYGMLRYRFVSPLDPDKFDNTTSKAQEIATRALIFTCAALAFTFAGTHIALAATVMVGIGSMTFRALGFALQKERFTHVAGNAPEKSLSNGQATVMTWKICGEFGGLQYRQGGVVNWRSRIDKIVEKIKAQDPDILVLHQVKDTALIETLIERLGDQYAHFFTHIGGSTWQGVNGCLVISKCAVDHFSYHETNQGESSFEVFTVKAHPEDKTPCVRFLAAELISGKENKEKRMEQVAQIASQVAQETLVLPTLLVGSNAFQDDAEEAALLSQYLYHSYRGKEPTSTEQLAIQWDPKYKEQGETYDFISLFKRNTADGRTLSVIEKDIRLLSCELVRGFSETFDTRTALSNHHGLSITFTGLKTSR